MLWKYFSQWSDERWNGSLLSSHCCHFQATQIKFLPQGCIAVPRGPRKKAFKQVEGNADLFVDPWFSLIKAAKKQFHHQQISPPVAMPFWSHYKICREFKNKLTKKIIRSNVMRVCGTVVLWLCKGVRKRTIVLYIPQKEPERCFPTWVHCIPTWLHYHPIAWHFTIGGVWGGIAKLCI